MAKFILTSEKERGVVRSPDKTHTEADVLKLMQRMEPQNKWTECQKIPRGFRACPYCYALAEGTQKDLLCGDCRELFGHSLISEL